MYPPPYKTHIPFHKGVREGYPLIRGSEGDIHFIRGSEGDIPPHKGVRGGYPPPYTSLWDLNFSISADPILSGI